MKSQIWKIDKLAEETRKTNKHKLALKRSLLSLIYYIKVVISHLLPT